MAGPPQLPPVKLDLGNSLILLTLFIKCRRCSVDAFRHAHAPFDYHRHWIEPNGMKSTTPTPKNK
jgi:hypothetical protein